MRAALAALAALLVLASGARALEIEDRRRYEGTGPAVLRIASTADLDVFAPYLEAFHAANPETGLDYMVVSSAELHRAVRAGEPIDVAISSAMDLQFKLANDGFARPHRSAATAALPGWARWRDDLFAFAAEPAVALISPRALAGLEVPTTRQGLIASMRAHPERYRGAVGTYDVRRSGLGYLLATQEARATDAFWRLSEVMGGLEPRLYCCSGEMIEDVAEGRLALAYNVLGSYAADRIARQSEGRLRIVSMTDGPTVILRTVLVPAQAPSPAAAGRLVDMLISTGLDGAPGDWPLPPLRDAAAPEGAGFGPIRLGPALMVYLDPLNRRSFLEQWTGAYAQR